MSEDLSSQFDELMMQKSASLSIGTLAKRHDELRTLQGKVEAAKKAAAKELMHMLDEMGVDSIKADGRRVGTRTVTYYGIAEGSTPEERLEHVNQLRKMFTSYAPELDVPASSGVKRLIEAWMEEDPSRTIEDLPPCISKRETISLTNARVS